MNDKRKKVHESLLLKFDAPKGYKIRDYYGTMMMKIKKNNKFRIKLIYDYKAHSVCSTAIEVDSLEKAMKLIEIMEEFAIDGTEKNNEVDAMLDDI